jgi:hypothetical protein
MDRRQFVAGSGASAFAALGWLRGFGQATALAAVADAARPSIKVALAVVEAILPFEDRRFPLIAPENVRKRMYAIFSLDGDASFASTLALFDSVGAWMNPPQPIVALEMLRYGTPDLAHDRDLMQKSLADLKLESARFADLGLDDRRAYLTMWSRSSFGVRRRIYQSFKALVHASAYSMDALWTAIGYEGPLVSRGSAS